MWAQTALIVRKFQTRPSVRHVLCGNKVSGAVAWHNGKLQETGWQSDGPVIGWKAKLRQIRSDD